MAKRLIDATCALVALALLWPLLLVAAIGIRLQSPGPILYRARRAGRYGLPFDMLKLRTMHVRGLEAGSRITAERDSRVFAFGVWLRRTKIDELPQLVNILRGEMSVIGPRPEDPHFVADYRGEAFETLAVRPGLASPGSLYHDSHGAQLLGDGDPEIGYRQRLLPIKLALDVAYVRRATVWYDVRLMVRTLWHVIGRLVGRRDFPEPEEFLFLRRGAPRSLHRQSMNATSATRRAPRMTALPLLLIAFATACSHQTGDPTVRGPRPGWLTDANASILVGAGDIAFCDSDADAGTASLLDSIPGTVFTTGDHAYPDGTAAEFAACYAPYWGRHRARTRPVPGNHDYRPDSSGRAYHEFFGELAGAPGKGWYSYELGGWHIVALNSEVAMGPESEQARWLVADLRDAAAECVLAYWHRPLFSSPRRGQVRQTVVALWDILYAAGAEVVLNGHDHRYERFAPQSPAGALDDAWGIRQFIVGTGGPSDHLFGAPRPHSQVRRSDQPGVLALNLRPGGYDWYFVAVAPSEFSDAGTGTCHGARPPAAPPGTSP